MTEYEGLDILSILFSTYVAWFTFFITANTGTISYLIMKKEKLDISPRKAKWICVFFEIQIIMAIIATFFIFFLADDFVPNSNHAFITIVEVASICFIVSLVSISGLWVWATKTLIRMSVKNQTSSN